LPGSTGTAEMLDGPPPASIAAGMTFHSRRSTIAEARRRG